MVCVQAVSRRQMYMKIFACMQGRRLAYACKAYIQIYLLFIVFIREKNHIYAPVF